ncbi:hypothetical protein ACNKHT_22500 [Shigella flexneri]
MPVFGFSLSLILLPLVLVGLKNHCRAFFVPEGWTAYEWFELTGDPFTAILVARLVAIYGLGNASGHAKRQSDGDLRSRAATGDHSAGDWCRRRVQTGAG